MPYVVRKIRNQPYYSVKNAETGQVHSQHTTRKNAMAQVRLLQSVGGMRRHVLFGNTGLPVPPAPIPPPAPAPPPRPPTPDMRDRYSLGFRADELFRRERARAAPAAAAAAAPAAAAASSSSSSSSSSAASSFSLTPTIRFGILDRTDLDRIQQSIRDGLPMTPVLVPIYNALKKIKNEDERARYATALYNLGYTKETIKEMIRGGQFSQLIRHIQSNFSTLIPARRGGKRRGGMKRAKLDTFGRPRPPSPETMPAPEPRPGFESIGVARLPAPLAFSVPAATITVPQPSGGLPDTSYSLSDIPAFVANPPQSLRDIIAVLMLMDTKKMERLSPSAKIAFAMAFHNMGWTGRTIRALEYTPARALFKYVGNNIQYIVTR